MELDLDAKIAALQHAVESGDHLGVTTQLAAIERELQAMNPLLRGMTYAHVKSVMGEPAQAVAVVEDLLELMPDSGVIYYQLGCYRKAAGDEEGALAAFTRATELDGSLADAWISRGMLLDARGEPLQAIEAYRHAILRAPAEVDVWRNLGNSLAALGHFDEALEAYRTATGLAPDDATISFLVASAHQAKGDVTEANVLLPEVARQELGQVDEVRIETGERPLCCRFHAPAARAEDYREAARALLREIEPIVVGKGEEAFPMARDLSFLVVHEGVVLLCDSDPKRSGLPNRFFDATRVVARAVTAPS